MAGRKKRSISMPADLDAQIEEAATAGGVTFSAWLAAAARKEFLLQDGLDGVAQFQQANGAFTDAELAEAETWASDAVSRSRRTGAVGRHLDAGAHPERSPDRVHPLPQNVFPKAQHPP